MELDAQRARNMELQSIRLQDAARDRPQPDGARSPRLPAYTAMRNTCAAPAAGAGPAGVGPCASC